MRRCLTARRGAESVSGFNSEAWQAKSGTSREAKADRQPRENHRHLPGSIGEVGNEAVARGAAGRYKDARFQLATVAGNERRESGSESGQTAPRKPPSPPR